LYSKLSSLPVIARKKRRMVEVRLAEDSSKAESLLSIKATL
jgi:hypothetical protein